MYDRRLKVFRGVSNPITFTFKNEDQKAQFIDSKTLEFNLIDTETSKSVLTKNLTILDDGSTSTTKGKATVTITEGDLLPLDAKFYNYSIREVESDNSRTVTYTDTSYNSAGTVEIQDGGYPQFVASTVINNFTRSSLTSTSGSISASPGTNNNSALHTVTVYSNNFAGTFTIEGSLVSNPTQDTDWVTVSENSISSSNTINYYNFNGVLSWVRFKWTNTSGNTGIVDKILYRH